MRCAALITSCAFRCRLLLYLQYPITAAALGGAYLVGRIGYVEVSQLLHTASQRV